MAKALLGHVGSTLDLRLVDEVRRLRLRVRQLEDELATARSDSELLAAAVGVVEAAAADELADDAAREPALA